ncbi:hypothetical protein HYH03_010602 [Edaphochlamys debaryana]|uniref:Uncharacterized protein n=1 Tax=Edaphochlamys debaryana TaxID=47281 RepID=A0A835XTI6_9CHLO|nr:hypothetical protein HYH03_010602 [Edaphochlamys debaryana]|eukprot:KAG2490922.1 hypothetical protein HYH03_010602 [Edaphochlamys debaryana]
MNSNQEALLKQELAPLQSNISKMTMQNYALEAELATLRWKLSTEQYSLHLARQRRETQLCGISTQSVELQNEMQLVARLEAELLALNQ